MNKFGKFFFCVAMFILAWAAYGWLFHPSYPAVKVDAYIPENGAVAQGHFEPHPFLDVIVPLEQFKQLAKESVIRPNVYYSKGYETFHVQYKLYQGDSRGKYYFAEQDLKLPPLSANRFAGPYKTNWQLWADARELTGQYVWDPALSLILLMLGVLMLGVVVSWKRPSYPMK